MPTLYNGPIDALLESIRGGTTMRVLSGEPGNLAEAIAMTLGTATVSAGDYGPIASDSTGRTMSGPTAQASITGSGTVTHLSIDNGTTLLHVNMPVEPHSVDSGSQRNVTYGAIRVLYAGVVA